MYQAAISVTHASAQRLVTTATGVGVAATVACLCWRRGGVDSATYSAVFGVVLTLAGLLFWCAPRLGGISLPWPVAVVALLPVLQLAPLGPARDLLWQPWRQDLEQLFARFGIESPTSISLYPFATLRGAVLLAGCCALFVVARAMARRHGEAVAGVVAALLAVAAGEAILGLGQWAGATWPGAPTTGSSTAHGTFVNRNHFAVLLEAGFCLGAGLAASMRSRARSFAEGRPHRFARLASLFGAALCLAGVAASGSRMGLLVGCAAVLASAFVFAGPNRRGYLLPASLLTVLLATAWSSPGTARGLMNLFRDGGDAGRMAIWPDALTAAARHLPAGSGLGTFVFAFRRGEPYFLRNTVDHAHSDWLELLVELALPVHSFWPHRSARSSPASAEDRKRVRLTRSGWRAGWRQRPSCCTPAWTSRCRFRLWPPCFPCCSDAPRGWRGVANLPARPRR